MHLPSRAKILNTWKMSTVYTQTKPSEERIVQLYAGLSVGRRVELNADASFKTLLEDV